MKILKILDFFVFFLFEILKIYCFWKISKYENLKILKISKSQNLKSLKKPQNLKLQFFFSKIEVSFFLKKNIFGQYFEEKLFWPLLNFKNALLWSKRIISLPCTMFMWLMLGMLGIFLTIWNFCAEEAHCCKFRSYRENKKNFCAEESHCCKFWSLRENTCDQYDRWAILALLKWPFFNLSLERHKITNRDQVQNDGKDISFRPVNFLKV